MKKTVLITGASRGIGLETARMLAAEDSDFSCMVMIARPSPEFDEAVISIRKNITKCEVIAINADLSDPLVVDEIYDQLDRMNVRVTTIINNAGFTKPASINEAELADFELTMRVNLFSPFKMIQEALRRNHPLKQLVNIASTAGMGGRGGWLTYSTSKAAVINMSEVLRDELKPYGVDVICLSPGRCATDLRKTLAPDEDPSTIMQPQQVASVVKMMTSEVGSLLHSQNLVVRT